MSSLFNKVIFINFFLLILSISISTKSLSQYDTLMSNDLKKIALNKEEKFGQKVYSIKKISFPYPSLSFFENVNYFKNADSAIQLLEYDSCSNNSFVETNNTYDTSLINHYSAEFKDVEIKKCDFVMFPIFKTKIRNLTIDSSKFQNIYIDASTFKEINFSSNIINSIVDNEIVRLGIGAFYEINTLSNSNIQKLSFNHNIFSNFRFNGIFFSYYNFDYLEFNNNYFQNDSINFYSDTIKNFLFNSISLLSKDNKFRIIFRDCFIGRNFNIEKFNKNLIVVFENCTFDNNSFLNITCDSCYFSNCILNDRLQILFHPNTKKVVNLSIWKTDPKKMNFFYSNFINLFFRNDLDQDDVTYVYENLISNYKVDGKLESLKNIDIEYKQNRYSQRGAIGIGLNFLDKIWWNYGYKKYFIVYWTFVFLVLFFVINFITWEEVSKIYTLNFVDNYHFNNYFFRKEVFYIVLFTMIIFFSLRINFDKINYRNKVFVAYFFLQYFIGLICLFFLVNAVFKF